jgi:hypothetical protein
MSRLNSTTATTTRKRSALLRQEEAPQAVFGSEVDNAVVTVVNPDGDSKLVKRRQAYRRLHTKVVVTCKIDGRIVLHSLPGVSLDWGYMDMDHTGRQQLKRVLTHNN